MYAPWVLIAIILISSLPVIAVYVWFRAAKYQFSLVLFLCTLLAGAASFFPALLLQDLLDISFSAGGRAALFYLYFIRIALSEELSRLFILFIFFWISGHITRPDHTQDTKTLSISTVKKATATGLVAGLGFALLENARYAASGIEIDVLLLRIFTAAIHGACGSRIGAAAVMFRFNPIQALLRIVTATAIHGIYNLMVTRPGISSIAASLIAVSALITTIMIIRDGWTETKSQQIP